MLFQLSESELMSLRSLVLDYALKPDTIQEFHDVIANVTLTPLDLVAALGDDTRRSNGVHEVTADLTGGLQDVDQRRDEIEQGKAASDG